MWAPGPEGFTMFFEVAEPKLRRALIGVYGAPQGRDAAAEALLHGWRHWERVRVMENPVGYLYRVGQSKGRARRVPRLQPEPWPMDRSFEPGLPAALDALSERERVVVVLIEGFGCTFREVAELLGVSSSSIQSYLGRGLQKLRVTLGVSDDA
jgi:DNA-directed RNA polymerase specialized sigma24 family protein